MQRMLRCALLLSIAARLAAELEEPQGGLLRLAARVRLPVEPPTVVLVGHHNDGKSALLEALVGFSLTQVGSSISTRRVLRIDTRHDPSREQPAIFVEKDGGSGDSAERRREEPMSAEDLRRYIEAENLRLSERGEYDANPIRVIVRWRHASNMALLDTPGLLSASQVGLSADGVGGALADAALLRQSRAVEELVINELTPPSRLILCLEDTSDWALTLTRAVVCKADPQLSRTLLVATKLDAKLAQFAMAEDLHRLLNPRDLMAKYPRLLAGPIFTSVPPIHVSRGKSFLQAIEENESSLKGLLAERLGSDVYASRIGIGALNEALLPHLSGRWAQQLSSASKTIESRMSQLHQQLEAPPPPPAAESLDDFAERFGKAVHALIKGTVDVSAAEHGETLDQERHSSTSGALCSQTDATPTPSEAGDAETSVMPRSDDGEELWLHANKRLYGGAQYWRALQEFMLGAIEGPTEEVSVEEILNAMGFDGYHDGVNYMRAVCVIVVEKAKGCFEHNLSRLRLRLLHVMRRLVVPVDEMLRSETAYGPELEAAMGAPEADGLLGPPLPLSREQHTQYMALAQPLYTRFVEEVMDSCLKKCLFDVEAITKYVVWDSNSATRESLYNVFVQPVSAQLQRRADARRANGGSKRRGDPGSSGTGAAFATYEELVASFTEVLTSRRVSEEMRVMITQLVAEIICAWRQEFCRMISLKLNSFFLMPFCETLPKYMRRSLCRLEREQALGLSPPTEEEEARRTKRLRAELDSLTAEKDELHRIANQMRRQSGNSLRSMPAVSKVKHSAGGMRREGK